jgi:hypothetical protein
MSKQWPSVGSGPRFCKVVVGSESNDAYPNDLCGCSHGASAADMKPRSANIKSVHSLMGNTGSFKKSECKLVWFDKSFGDVGSSSATFATAMDLSFCRALAGRTEVPVSSSDLV